jgi:hypothetical protein
LYKTLFVRRILGLYEEFSAVSAVEEAPRRDLSS